MLCETLTQQCINRNEIYQFFVRRILCIGGKEKFSGTILNYDRQSPLKCNINESRNNDNSLFVLFQ
jgi:hypothetical protein